MKNIILFTIISLLAVSCGSKSITTEEVTEQKAENTVTLTSEQFKNAGVETGTFSSQKIASILKVNGKVDVPPQSIVSISVPLGGYLKSTGLLPGMSIKKGQILAVIEDQQYIQLQQDYLTAKAQFAFHESEYNRQKDLNQSKASSDKVFEQAKVAYQTQNVLVKSLEQKLLLIGLNPEKVTANNITKSVNIYAPINGFVSAVNVNIGKYVNPSDILFELVNPNDIQLALSVFEKDVHKLAVGQKLFAYTNDNPTKKYVCEIIYISPNLSDNNATEVHCRFNEFDKKLILGMFMNAEIEIDGNHAFALPEEAIVRFENKQYVFVEKENLQFEMKAVKTGNTENNYVEILDGASLSGQQFALKGAYNLLMALKNTNDE